MLTHQRFKKTIRLEMYVYETWLCVHRGLPLLRVTMDVQPH